jgi:hypothetical protein
VKDAAIVAWLMEYLDVTRPELDHVVQCDDCSITGWYAEGGPMFCKAFRDEFRPEPVRVLTAAEAAEAERTAAVYGKLYDSLVAEALRPALVFGGSADTLLIPPDRVMRILVHKDASAEMLGQPPAGKD